MKNDIHQFDPADVERTKVVSALSYLGILFFLPLVVYPDSKYARFHANQSLLCLVLYIALNIVSAVLGWVPLVGWLIKGVCWIACMLILLYGMIATLQGQAKELPFIGHIRIIS